MMQRTVHLTLAAAVAALALTACGEKPQTGMGIRSRCAALRGHWRRNFTQPGWKAGDKSSWEAQLKRASSNSPERIHPHPGEVSPP